MRWIYKTSALGKLREAEMVSGSASKKVGFLRQDTSSVAKLGFAVGLNDVLGRKRHSAGLRFKVLVCRTWLIKK